MMSTKFDTIEAGWKALSRGKTNLDIDQFDSVLHKSARPHNNGRVALQILPLAF